MPQNLFPSNSLRYCFFFVLTVKENKQLCLKIKTNFKSYVFFFSLRQIGAESCFSVETMWLRKQGTCVTPIVQVICWRGRGRISLTQNDLYTNRALASEEIFNITAVCLSPHAPNGLFPLLTMRARNQTSLKAESNLCECWNTRAKINIFL